MSTTVPDRHDAGHQFNSDQAYRWLTELYGDRPGLIQIGRLPRWTGRTFDSREIKRAVEYARGLDSGEPTGVYWRVTTLRTKPTSGRGGEADSYTLPALWADLDIAGPGHKTGGPLPPDDESARKVVEEAALPDPSAWIHSGGGLYPIWQLDSPAEVTDVSLAEIKALSRGWQDIIGAAAQRLGWHYGTGVGDLARVLRLPGSVNRKEGLSRPCRIMETTGRRYSLANLAEALLDAQSALPKPEPRTSPKLTAVSRISADADPIQPGDDYERRTDWAQILEPHGWTLSHARGTERYWCRPGKARRDGHSATTGRANDRDRLYVFSDATEFPQGEPVTKFRAYALLNHGGDYKAAAKELARLGYGTPAPNRDVPASAKVNEPKPDLWAGVDATLDRPDAGAEWDEPLPIGWQTDLPPFPVDALPPAVRDYVTALSAEVQTPVDMAATVALGVAHGAIGGTVHIRLRPGYVEPTNQYCGLVAPPGSRKSKIVSECRKPLDMAERQMQAAMADEIENASVQRRALDMYAEKALRKAGESGDPIDIEMAQEAAAEARKVAVPCVPRLVMGDTTPERMIQLMRDHGRMAAISAEAGIIDALTGRHAKRPNLDPILKAHIGDRLDNETVGRGQETAASPALTLVFALQPYALHQLAKPDGDAAGRGLIARPVWSITPDITGTRTWDGSVEMSAAVRSGYETLIRDVAITMTLLGRLDEPVTLTLDPAAGKAIGEYHDRVEQLAAPGGECGAGLIREWIHKLVGAVGRVAAVIHILTAPPPSPARNPDGRIATDAAIDWTPSEVGEATIGAAIRIGEYYRAHAAAALGGGEDRRAPGARQLLSWLLAHNEFAFAARDIQRSGPRPLRKAGPLSEAIDYLQSLGWVRPADGKGYELRPDAHTLATAATAATKSATSHISAGHSAGLESDGLSPRLATGGDNRDDECHLSPVVAKGGDNAESALTSADSGAVAAVAAVATIGATHQGHIPTLIGQQTHSVTEPCIGCGAAPTGADRDGNPRCERCMPLGDDVEEWSA